MCFWDCFVFFRVFFEKNTDFPSLNPLSSHTSKFCLYHSCSHSQIFIIHKWRQIAWRVILFALITLRTYMIICASVDIRSENTVDNLKVKYFVKFPLTAVHLTSAVVCPFNICWFRFWKRRWVIVLCDIMCDISNLFRPILYVISALLSVAAVFLSRKLIPIHGCSFNICCCLNLYTTVHMADTN
jgi:hypothetical protein